MIGTSSSWYLLDNCLAVTVINLHPVNPLPLPLRPKSYLRKDKDKIIKRILHHPLLSCRLFAYYLFAVSTPMATNRTAPAMQAKNIPESKLIFSLSGFSRLLFSAAPNPGQKFAPHNSPTSTECGAVEFAPDEDSMDKTGEAINKS